MDTIEFDETLEQFLGEMRTLLSKKGMDYAEEADRLSGFKHVAELMGSSPELVCLNLIAVKVVRLKSLLTSGKKPSNESVEDSILDLANYSALLNAIMLDKRKLEK